MADLFSSLFTTRRPFPEPGSKSKVRTPGGRDAIIFRRIPIETLVQDPQSFTLSYLRQQVDPQVLAPTFTISDVELLVNPFRASFETPRDIQVSPSSAKGRYVAQDWGTGLTTVHLDCQTGCIIPFKNPPPPSVSNPVKQVQTNGLPQVDTFDTRGYIAPMSGYGWTSLVMRSERFTNFLSVYVTYHDFDADTEILLMTFGRAIFRGFMQNFRWELVAETAWNVKYSFDFVVMAGMDSWTRGISGDDQTAWNFLHASSAADDVPFPDGFDEARLNDSPIVVGRTSYSIDGNGGASVFDPGGFVSFSDPFKGTLPVSLGI